jgi:hypothetical protein
MRLPRDFMTFRAFRHNFHDSQLVGFRLGPRRELTLEIALDPVWNKAGPPSASVRFGGIENFDDVASFFHALPPPRRDAYVAEIIGLRYPGDGPNWVVLDLSGHGHIRIQSRHVTEF